MIIRSAFMYVILALVLHGAPAAANTLTITGGFTNFLGVVGGGQYTTTINGSTVCPYSDCASGIIAGDGLLDIVPSAQRVDFGFTQFGVAAAPNALSLTLVNSSDPNYVTVGGGPVKIADLFFQNGTWFGRAQFGFTLFATSCDAGGICTNGSWGDVIVMDVHTVNGGSAEANADEVHFANGGNFGSLFVYEPADSATPYASIEIMAMIGSLIPTGFGNVTGEGGFFVPAAANTVPLPAALPLFAAGLSAMGFMGWRRNRKAA